MYQIEIKERGEWTPVMEGTKEELEELMETYDKEGIDTQEYRIVPA